MNTRAPHQGVSFHALVKNASDDELRPLVPAEAHSLLTAMDPSALEGDKLRRMVLTSSSLLGNLTDPEKRRATFKLLGSSEAKVLAARLGASLAVDPRIALESLPESLSTAQLTDLLAFFGVSEPTEGTVSVTRYGNSALARYPLFTHQRNALRRVQESLYGGGRRVVLHMPTGAGKTRTAMNAVAEHLRSREPSVVCWLATSEELLEQAASEFEAAWSFLGNREVTVVRYWGNRSADLADISDGLVVAGLGKMNAASTRDFNLILSLADVTSLVVMDEAHQSIARTYARVLNILSSKRPDTSLLGLTATPGRTYSDIASDAELANYWSGQKVMLEIEGYSNPVTYLVEEGYLARPKFRIVEAGPSVHPTDSELLEMRSGLEAPDELVRRLGADDQWNMVILTTTIELLSRHRRVIVFTTTVGQAVILSAVMRALGHDARTVTGMTPKPERESILQRYTNGSMEPMAIFNYGVLTTGFDAPSTSAAVIARPTKSLVLYSQMIGRALRGPRAGGNAEAEIVTVVDPELPGFGDPAEAFLNWEDVWS